MWIHRLILDLQLESARFPATVITSIINDMRSHFAPVQTLDTRIFRDHGLVGTWIQISLPGTYLPHDS